MKKKSVVLGGSGFVGQALCRALSTTGETPTILDVIPPPDSRFPFIPVQWGREKRFLSPKLSGISTLYYLAWSTKPASANRDPLADFLDNVEAALRFLEEYRREGYSFRLVFVSSGGAVYGEHGNKPAVEREAASPINAYGIGKLTVEHYLSLYHRLHGLDYVSIRPSNAYGEGQNPFSDLGAINVFLGKILRGQDIEIWGDGSVVRDYVHIDDLVRALIAAGNYHPGSQGNRVFNIASGEACSLKHLLKIIARTVHKPITVHYSPGRIVDVHKIRLDIKAAKRHLGWTPAVSLAEGVEKTWEWIRKTHGTDGKPGPSQKKR